MKQIQIDLLHAGLKQAGFREIRFSDNSYVAPSLDWLKEFGRYLRSNKLDYFTDKYDCENFARWAACEADKALYQTDVSDSGHTFGEATCVMTQGGQHLSHALNVCVCDDEKLYVLEPQTGEVSSADGFPAVWCSVRM